MAAANAVSILMPYVEPFFASTINAALRTDATIPDDLRSRSKIFVAQELQHQREHRVLNAAVRSKSPKVHWVEQRARHLFGWLHRTRSLPFNLAFAAASEALAYGLARWASNHLAVFERGANNAVTRLFIWHLAEEVEHKSVARDVYDHVDGSRRRYAWAAAVSLLLVAVFVVAGSLVQLAAARRLRSPLTWWRLVCWSVSLAFEIVPTLVVSALPGHHPDQFVDPSWYGLWLRDLGATAAR